MPESRKLGNQTFPYVLVGDQAFPLKTYMMRPYLRKDLNNEKKSSTIDYPGPGMLSKTRLVFSHQFGEYTDLQCN